MEKLKNCPFCGSCNVDLYSYDPFDGYRGDLERYKVSCLSCGCNLERIKKDDAIAAWNRRANENDE